MATGTVVVADIGGTQARFALLQAGCNAQPTALQCLQALRCADYPDPETAVRAYLRQLGLAPADLQAMVLAVAAPVSGDDIRFSNSPWHFNCQQLATSLSLSLTVLNDFEAQAWCLPHLAQLPQHLVNPGRAQTGALLIAGPGTGLGVAACSTGGEILCTEAGHAAFAPLDALQRALLSQLWQWYPRVTLEHLLSGPGLSRIHAGLSCLAGQPQHPSTAPTSHEILQAADQPLAQQTLALFSRMLGAACGDLVLVHGARRGLVLSGGLLQAMGSAFDQQVFLQAFVSKGDFSDYCQQVPVSLLLVEHPGLLGAAYYAQSRTCWSPH